MAEIWYYEYEGQYRDCFEAENIVKAFEKPENMSPAKRKSLYTDKKGREQTWQTYL